MFRQLKSAIIWTYVYRYRSLLFKTVVILLLLILIEFIYRDIVQYLQMAKKIEYMPYILFGKWSLFFGALLYLIMNTKKSLKKSEKMQKSDENKKHKSKQQKLTKKEIAALAQDLIEKKKKRI
ncbi:hypothetical protein [Nitratiruptor tergarcus]|uniref:Uncharacterized protein n=1 Tax=Nitratiruptor tergarcus DSM 16512 TaxID=1069081 RepID=A0A1W1WTJ6_9BACT|nr:hypothetical protein [Nitratiruptor tergarcus]SMC09644.1 hypothetical protein SAMN05660197_1465 [Nitratiruptor tergarcus DSM 16512]